MKIVAKGKAGKMVLIGGTGKGEATWYAMTPETKPIVDTLAIGTEVTITSDKVKGTDTLLSITASGGGQSSAPAPVAQGAAAPAAPVKTGWTPKSPAEQDSIKRQAIGHMTSRSLIALQGFITPDNIEEVAGKLYAKFVQLVG